MNEYIKNEYLFIEKIIHPKRFTVEKPDGIL